MRQRLFEQERDVAGRRTDCTDLVLFAPDRCIRCGGEVQTKAFGQPALFRHGGYGATLRTTWRECIACLWFFVCDITEVHPDWSPT